MPIVIGILLIPIILLIIKLANLITLKKSTKIALHILLILISIIYVIVCLITRVEPFDFDITYSLDYMIYDGDFILNAGIIVCMTPFIWIVVVYFARKILRMLRIRKNAKIKGNDEFLYYREDLDKVSPSAVMYTSQLEIDIKKCIASTILKLKLMGYIKENGDSFIYTNKDEFELLKSEKMVLQLIRNGKFDSKLYKETVKEEAIQSKYVVKNGSRVSSRIGKIMKAILAFGFVILFSIFLDNYTFENYHVWPEDDGHVYIELHNDKEIERLSKQATDESDYYGRIINVTGEDIMRYDSNMIRADRLQYSVVRKAFFLHILCSSIIGFIGVFFLFFLYIIIEQIINIKNNYRRTIKGKTLVNKAYALKNYLKEYSLIKDRTEKELVLWEYYLIYATLLDLNVKLEDDLIEKYVKEII